MARFVATAPLEPGHFERFLSIQVPGTETSFTGTTASFHTYTFTGLDFSYDGGGVLGGTIRTIAEEDDEGTPLFRVTGLSLPVAEFAFATGFVNAGDLFAGIFTGNDSFTGSAGNDTLDAQAGADTLSAGAGDDVLLGGGGDDSLAGGDGDDTFDGGGGADRMLGGAGDDAFLVRQASDVVSEAPDGGYDSVASYVTRTLGPNQESLVLLGDGALAGAGNGLANVLMGNSAANALTGAEGSDTLIGGAGADDLDAGVGHDLLFGQAPFIAGDVPLTAAARTYLFAQDNSLVRGLGGASGFGENALAVGDERSSPEPIDLTSVFGPAGLVFFGKSYTSLYVNNNGNVSFDSPLTFFDPEPITGGSLPMIAPFWADVDTRPNSGTAANRVYWDVDLVNDVITVTWNSVGFYDQHATPANSFQLQLVNRGGGDFDIVFRYRSINWTTGDASGGAAGLGGTVARAGYAAGNGISAFELAQSGDQAEMLALDTTAGNTGRTGTYVFAVRNGDVLAIDDGAEDTLAGGSGRDTLKGAGGGDSFVFAHAGPGNADLVLDFTPGKDVIVLDSGFFAELRPAAALGTTFYQAAGATSAHDADDRVVYNTATGKLYYDPDGIGGANAVLVATLAQAPAGLAAGDFVVI